MIAQVDREARQVKDWRGSGRLLGDIGCLKFLESSSGVLTNARELASDGTIGSSGFMPQKLGIAPI